MENPKFKLIIFKNHNFNLINRKDIIEFSKDLIFDYNDLGIKLERIIESILPTPQEVKIKKNFICFNGEKDILGNVFGINEDHWLIRQFKEEVWLSFGIRIKFQSNTSFRLNNNQGNNIKKDINDKNFKKDQAKTMNQLRYDKNLYIKKQIKEKDIKSDEINPEIPQFNNNILEKYYNLEDFQKEEFYSLNISTDKIVIEANNLHGLFNGFQTFYQLFFNIRTYYNNKENAINKEELYYVIPCVQIYDWPILKIRGVSDDVARAQLPKLEFVKDTIKILSRFKTNYYGLYLEDAFSCSQHPSAAEDRAVFSPEELMQIDEYAKKHFIKLFPIFETLGHMDNILFLPEYRELGEFPGAHSFALSNGNIYPFLRDYIGELSAVFSSNIFHIGCDESFDVGQYASKPLIKQVGYKQALFDHFRRVYEITKDYGNKEIMIYHDAFTKSIDLLERMPKDIEIVYWDYRPAKKFSGIEKYLKSGHRLIVSPTTFGWTRHFPDQTSASGNIKHLIDEAKNLKKLYPNQILGELNSTWGDFGNRNFNINNIYGLIYSATCSWSKKSLNWDNFLNHLIPRLFSDNGINLDPEYSIIIKIISDINNIHNFYRKTPVLFPQSFYRKLFEIPHRIKNNKIYTILKKKERITALEMYQYCDDLLQNMREITKRFTNNKYMNENNDEAYYQYNNKNQTIYSYLWDYLIFSVKIARVYALKQKISKGSEIKNFINEWKKVKEEYIELWKRISNDRHLKPVIDNFNQVLSIYNEFSEILEKQDNFSQNRKALIYPYLFYSDLQNNYNNKRIYKERQYPVLQAPYIWTNERISHPEMRYFRRKFTLKSNPSKAIIQVIAGNYAELWINGIYIGEVLSRMSLSIRPFSNSITTFDISPYLKKGENVILIAANHFMESFGSLNIVLQVVFNEDNELNYKKNVLYELYTDPYWIYRKRTLTLENNCVNNNNLEKWSDPKYRIDLNKWKRVKIVGYTPKFNGWLYHPDLMNNRRSLGNESFGSSSYLYFPLQFLIGKRIAKIIRLFTHLITRFNLK